MKTWNRERKRTRDLLLEYDLNIMPPHPRSGGIMPMIYPWENYNLSALNYQLYLIAKNGGFEGTLDEFNTLFASFVGARSIIFVHTNEFPEEGATDKLYFDLDEKILYYWDNDYIPVNAMLIANTTIYGGEA